MMNLFPIFTGVLIVLGLFGDADQQCKSFVFSSLFVLPLFSQRGRLLFTVVLTVLRTFFFFFQLFRL